MRFEEHVIGCFKGLATGDAVGKQTETLSRDDVRRWYPEGISGFDGRPGDVIPRYAGTRYGWRIGETTDDTEQTLAVARALLSHSRANHEAIGKELLRCRKSVHPDVSIWDFIQSGDASRIATSGNGSGAAMRAAPVGVIYPTDRMDELVRGVSNPRSLRMGDNWPSVQRRQWLLQYRQHWTGGRPQKCWPQRFERLAYWRTASRRFTRTCRA